MTCTYVGIDFVKSGLPWSTEKARLLIDQYEAKLFSTAELEMYYDDNAP